MNPRKMQKCMSCWPFVVMVGVLGVVGFGCETLLPSPDSEFCVNGRICPPGTHCTATGDACITTACGDLVLDLAGGEECDDGNAVKGDGCNLECKVERCGNDVVDLGEACDGQDGCSLDCRSDGSCGNGIVDPGEQCDDGNAIITDGCLSTLAFGCTLARCGDTVVWEGVERCDPTAMQGPCNASCTSDLSCGNGILDLGETCDDGNHINEDECPDGPGGGCRLARCGDTFLWDGVEDCDDGGTEDNDGCSSECKEEYCGDTVQQDGEECDPPGVSCGGFGQPVCDDSCHCVLEQQQPESSPPEEPAE